ncbi:PMT-domain-containing protein [Rhizoclosmatium globosum]|uniref:Dolichyl-phosphate-mannose--protein mannosyltransferase n=1 Tax=Rhizoclosmatium globosum TaxID=329046 RepID=A0A1Y2BW68_9FUNG|nr:PMT-domain-containing protein [Rhizoclosmatium globosum]|eukprot:ORY38992.1 PMT-domain-containing protein [Rhizoclosmatium globosum]
MYRIQDPAKVVFDEVHFGKFASYYLRGEYYFDVHPPLGKLLLGGVAALAGYDGHYLFDEINDDYVTHNVPWVSMRLFPALCGALIPPFCFLTLKEIGVSWVAAIFGAFMLIFDNALITQSRLILLDSMLLLFGVTSIYAWVRFYKERANPFSVSWWLWMSMTGISLALTLGIKMVGLFTIAVVGIAVLFDLWKLLDIDRGLSMEQFYKHFAARALCLIVLPVSLYLSFFYVHFALLPYSGPGDAFMSPKFQATLVGSELIAKSVAVPYSSLVTLKSKNQGVLLHSHEARYPLRYENGHVSSEGQQVTGYLHPDGNNVWEIIPVDPSQYPAALPYAPDATEKERGLRYLRNHDLIQLKHAATNSYLLTHDVASPLTNTNMEITTVKQDVADTRYVETLWKVVTTDGVPGDRIKSMRSHLKLVNVKHNVAINPNEKLPEWGFGQIEINGEKNVEAKNIIWYFEDVNHDTIVNGTDIYEPQVPNVKKAASMPFLQKFFELQNLMFVHNAALTTSHPYSSTPGTWPFVVRGVSFWETKEGLRQIYLLGNPFIWWFSIGCVAMFMGIWIVDRIVLRRQIDLFGPNVRRWFDNAIGFLFLAWLLHWIPFFLMGRMLFLHHYLPSFIFSTMLAAALMDFMFRIVNEKDPIRLVGGNKAVAATVPYFVYFKSSPYGNLLFVTVLVGLTGAFLWAFGYFSPLSYGYGLPDVEAIRARKWFKSWDLQHA